MRFKENFRKTYFKYLQIAPELVFSDYLVSEVISTRRSKRQLQKTCIKRFYHRFEVYNISVSA